jgi:hypothetical protein
MTNRSNVLMPPAIGWFRAHVCNRGMIGDRSPSIDRIRWKPASSNVYAVVKKTIDAAAYGPPNR